MARERPGEHDEARRVYDQAVDWIATNPPVGDDELRRIRAEAAEVLGIEGRTPWRLIRLSV